MECSHMSRRMRSAAPACGAYASALNRTCTVACGFFPTSPAKPPGEVRIAVPYDAAFAGVSRSQDRCGGRRPAFRKLVLTQTAIILHRLTQ